MSDKSTVRLYEPSFYTRFTEWVFSPGLDRCVSEGTVERCESPLVAAGNGSPADPVLAPSSAWTPNEYELPGVEWSLPLKAVLLFGVLPFALFGIWMLTSFEESGLRDAELRLWFAGSWLLLSPGLIVAWEQVRKRTLMSLDVRSGFRPCELDDINSKMDRARWAWLGLTVLLVVTAFVASNSTLSVLLGIGHADGLTYWLGVATFVWIGISFGTGFWGVGTAVATIRTAVAPGESIVWQPFEPSQVRGMEALSQFAYWTGILFATGGVAFFPLLSYLLVSSNPSLPPVGKTLGFFLAAMMLFGGLVVFVLPTVWIQRTARRQHDRYLRTYVQSLEEVEHRVLTGTSELGFGDETRVNALVSLRAAVEGQRAAPGPAWLVTRTVGIIALPLLTLTLQRVSGL